MFDTELDALQEVTSSNISMVGTKDHWLVIKFRNNQIYRYANQAHMFGDLVTADSVGRFFSQNIRDLPYEKIDELVSWDD